MSDTTDEDTPHDPERAIDGLDPQFAVENRVDLALQTVADIHTEWSYVQLGEGGLDRMRQKAEHLEDYAADLQAAIDRFEDEQTQERGKE